MPPFSGDPGPPPRPAEGANTSLTVPLPGHLRGQLPTRTRVATTCTPCPGVLRRPLPAGRGWAAGGTRGAGPVSGSVPPSNRLAPDPAGTRWPARRCPIGAHRADPAEVRRSGDRATGIASDLGRYVIPFAVELAAARPPGRRGIAHLRVPQAELMQSILAGEPF